MNISRILCGMVSAFIISGTGSALSEPAKHEYPLRGLYAISVSQETGDEVAIDLGRFEKRPVLIEVWASWCGPCLTALPHLERLQKDFPDLQVMPISVDDEATVVSQAYRQVGITSLPIYLDKAGSMMSFLNVRMYPTMLLFDSCGKMVFRQVGARPEGHKLLRQSIEGLVSSSCSV